RRSATSAAASYPLRMSGGPAPKGPDDMRSLRQSRPSQTKVPRSVKSPDRMARVDRRLRGNVRRTMSEAPIFHRLLIERDDEIQKLTLGGVVPLDVEIWPTCVVFRVATASCSRLDRTTMRERRPSTPTRAIGCRGANTTHAGGRFDLHLLVPII